MTAALLGFWNQCPLAGAPYIHPQDQPVLDGRGHRHVYARPMGFDEFVASEHFGRFKDNRFHVSLLPLPFGGNLAHADIIILLLNPRFISAADYYAETRNQVFRERLAMNLRQAFDGVDFPFLWLDPQFCWHSGFYWWERKLRDVITVIAERRFDGRYLRALQDLSRRLAHVELVPYRSSNFTSHNLVQHLPSAIQARTFVHRALVPAAQAGTKTVIITRRSAEWGELPEGGDRLVIYRVEQAQAASLGLHSSGRRAILASYGIPSDEAGC